MRFFFLENMLNKIKIVTRYTVNEQNCIHIRHRKTQIWLMWFSGFNKWVIDIGGVHIFLTMSLKPVQLWIQNDDCHSNVQNLCLAIVKQNIPPQPKLLMPYNHRNQNIGFAYLEFWHTKKVNWKKAIDASLYHHRHLVRSPFHSLCILPHDCH